MADDDPYVYPGTTVLRNHFGIRDAAELAEREAAHTVIRIAELERRFIPGDYDTAHLQAVHRNWTLKATCKPRAKAITVKTSN